MEDIKYVTCNKCSKNVLSSEGEHAENKGFICYNCLDEEQNGYLESQYDDGYFESQYDDDDGDLVEV